MATPPESLTIASRRECIDEARHWVSAHARAAGFGPEATGEIELALTEALANVIEHGYGGDESREIALSVALTGANPRDPGARLGHRVRRGGIQSVGISTIPGRAATACTSLSSSWTT